MDSRDIPDCASGKLHSSGLPPVQAQQVSQFLLARNYYLTALEFLVESIEHGCESEVTSLQEFFNDAEMFPSHELSKHQNHNALDLQTRAKEREERLQLLEYELRVSKEDLIDLKSQLLQTQEALAAQLSKQKLQEQCDIQSAGGNEARVSYGSPAAKALLHGSGFPEPSPAQLKELNLAVAAHLLSQGYKISALSLQEEAEVQVNLDPNTGSPLWEWYCKAHHLANVHKDTNAPAGAYGSRLEDASSCESVPSPTTSSPSSFVEEEQLLRQQLQTTQGQMQELQERLHSMEMATAQASLVQGPGLSEVASVHEAAVAGEDHEKQVFSCGVGASVDDSDGSDVVEDNDSAGVLENGQLRRKPSKARSLSVPSVGDSSVAMSAGVDIMRMVTDVLPKISSNLTMKSRQELLPLLQMVVTHHPTMEVRQAHLSLLFNLIPSPDSAQREAVIRECVELAKNLGPEWAASELLPLCVKAVSNQSAERRAMCVELTNALLVLVDLRSQFESIMLVLTQLADDRIPGVRESVAGTAAQLLEHLPFLRHFYTPLEELLFQCAKDTDEAVAAAVMTSYVPALLKWLQPTELVATQLLPRTLSTLQNLLRSRPASTQKPTHSRHSTHSSVDFSADEEMVLLNAGKPPPLEGHYLQARQLVRLFQLQLPHLADTALRTAPAWAYAVGEGVELTLPSEPQEKQANPYTAMEKDAAEEGRAASQVIDVDTGRSPLAPRSHNTPSFELPILAAGLGDSHHQEVSTTSPFVGSKPAEARTPQPSVPAATTAASASTTEPEGGAKPDFATWLNVGEQWRMWRTLSWCMQTMVPQLVLVMQALVASQEIMQLRLDLAQALQDTCKVLGIHIIRKAIVPMLAVAAASTCPPQIAGPSPAQHRIAPCTITWAEIPRHVQELTLQLAPTNEDEIEEARQRVLPFLLGVVLPLAGHGWLQSYVYKLMQPRQPGDMACWALQHARDLKGALQFSAGFPEASRELLELLSQLVHCGSLPQTLCAVALAQSLAPCVPAQVLSQSVLPALMTLLGAGDREVKAASIAALGDVSRQLSIFPPNGDAQLADSCQQKIHAIFDHLLQDGGHELQLCVFRTLSKVATLSDRLAGSGMLAQLEYLMQKLQFVLVQMQVSLSQQRSSEEMRELASLLLCILQATFTCECKDPKTQAYMSAAFQSMQTQRHLLDESQQESLNVMSHAQGSVAAPAYTSMQPSNTTGPASVPPLPTTGMASQRPHDPLNAPDVLKNVGAVVGSKLVNRWRGGWRGNKVAVAEAVAKSSPQEADHFFDE